METRDELEAMSGEQIVAVAKQRGISVRASDGSGTPSHEDYVDALITSPKVTAQSTGLKGAVPDEQPQNTGVGADKAKQAARIARQVQTGDRLDFTIPGGRYVSTDGRFVNAHGQHIHEDGTLVDAKEEQEDLESDDEFEGK